LRPVRRLDMQRRAAVGGVLCAAVAVCAQDELVGETPAGIVKLSENYPPEGLREGEALLFWQELSAADNSG
jgi:hypothetical protein